MHKKLIIEAFDKTKTELEKDGANDPSMLQLSTHLSDALEEHKIVFGYKSLQEYYKKAITLDGTEDINLSVRVVKGLCHYLGYNSYQEYILHKNASSNLIETERFKTLIPKRKRRTISLVISISFVLIVGAFLIFNATQQRWMLWNANHYEEVPFDQDQLSNGLLKLYKEDRILHFKKVDSADCDYEFFNGDGSVKIWYGKNRQGDLEFFTDVGLHPETGKTLKPITTYMIRKYVCDSI